MKRGIGSEARPGRRWPGLRPAMVGLLVCGLAIVGVLFSTAPALAAPSSSVLSPSPSPLDFGGTTDMNFRQSQQENFNNTSMSPTTVQSVTILPGPDASDFSIGAAQNSCTGQTIQAFSNCQLQVQFGPSSNPGVKTATLELVDDTGVVDVPVTGNAATGTITADQSSLDLGSQVVNQGGSSQPVTILTGQDFSVMVTNVQIDGPDASSFSVQGNGCQGFTMGTGSSCQTFIQFQPTSAGAKSAQLEIDNDGTVSPILVSLSGTGLNGPALSVNPTRVTFPNTALGSSAAQTLTMTNTGDAPLQFQELAVLAGSPQVFPLTDGCSGRQLAPGASCHATIGFVPIAAGVKDASLLVLSNLNGVTFVGLSGTGVAPATSGTGVATTAAGTHAGTTRVSDGSASLIGAAQAGGKLTCSPASFPPDTTFGYQWLKNGDRIAGATSRTLSLSNSDVGARFSCRVHAIAPGGTQNVTSPRSVATIALDLSLLHGAIIDQGVCRTLSTPKRLPGGAHAVFRNPITPWSLFTLRARSTMHVSLDDRALGSGTTVNVNPRTLSGFGDGIHTLQVKLAGHNDRTSLRLAPCQLATRLQGVRGRWSELTISARAGISTINAVLSDGLKLAPARRMLGQITFQSAGLPGRSFYLTGPRTTSNGVTVTLSRHAIRISGLPIQVGIISLHLANRVLLGRGGQVKTHATTPASTHPTSTQPTSTITTFQTLF
jgi:hypothetical protein